MIASLLSDDSTNNHGGSSENRASEDAELDALADKYYLPRQMTRVISTTTTTANNNNSSSSEVIVDVDFDANEWNDGMDAYTPPTCRSRNITLSESLFFSLAAFIGISCTTC